MMVLNVRNAVVYTSVFCLATIAFAVDPGDGDGAPYRTPLDVDRYGVIEHAEEYIEIGGAPSPYVAPIPSVTSPEMKESIAEVKSNTSTAISVDLARLDLATRANAVIQLEPLNAKAEASSASAVEAETQWNKGNFDLALAKIEQMEAAGGRFAVGIHWRQPIEADQHEYYLDVRVGSPNTHAEDLAMDFHRGTGNIFMVVSWGTSNANPSTDWSLNMSSDGGDTWVETFAYNGDPAPLVDMVVVGDYVYVAYVNLGQASDARFRRHFATTGASDTGYGFHNVASIGPATVIDVSAGGNADTFNNRIYMNFIDSNNNIAHFWGESAIGTSFTDNSPAGSASGGLDYAWNARTTTNAYRWLSYLGTDGAVHALKNVGGAWTDYNIETYTGSGFMPRTRISASDDIVVVVFQHLYPDGYGARYEISYEAGTTTFLVGSVYQPGVGEDPGWFPDVSLRSGARIAATYNIEAGAIDSSWFRTRSLIGAWDAPFNHNNYEVLTDVASYVQYIGSTCVSSYGLAYVGETDEVPFFDLTDVRAFFCDGFESGNTTAWN